MKTLYDLDCGVKRERKRARERARERARKGCLVFDHERLEVYQTAIDFAARADETAQNLPLGRGNLADQLYRASVSIPLNIAEGAGLWANREKQHAYRIARGSAMECAAILDVCIRLKMAPEDVCRDGKEMLLRIISMLTKLIQSLE